MMFVWEENGQKLVLENYSDIKELYVAIDEQKESDISILQYEQADIGFSFQSLKNLTIQFFIYHDIGAPIQGILPEPKSNSKYVVHKQNTEDNVCFLWCSLLYLHEVNVHRERVTHDEKGFTVFKIEERKLPLKAKIHKTLNK